MKNKKTLIMSIIIAILLIIIGVMTVLFLKKDNNSNSDTTNSTTAQETKNEYENNTDSTNNTNDNNNEENNKSDSIYLVNVEQSDSWESGNKKSATISITINNKSKVAIDSWKMDIIYNTEVGIDSIWCVEYTTSGNTLSVTPLDYNKKIGANESINFGYNVLTDDVTITDYILYIGDDKYSRADLEALKEKKDEQTTEEQSEQTTLDETKETSEEGGKASEAESGTPVANHGKLSVDKTQLVDKDGKAYQLKGCSTHGITWFPDYVNKDAFKTLRDDWGANLIRIAMYTDTGDSYGYCSGGNKDEILGLLDNGVNMATELGMYVIVDWHILNDNNPNNHIDDAKDFFDKVSDKYKDYDNVIYEICNEPNGGTSWSDVKEYANAVIPVIRNNDKEAIIIVGTPTWSQDVDIASEDPITGFDNIMYAVHFYAATHKQNIRDKVSKALENGIPVFVSEFSLCDASGNGGIDYDESDKWFELIKENNLSYASWSLCNKNETSALISSSSSSLSNWSEDELSETGKYIKEKISGK